MLSSASCSRNAIKSNLFVHSRRSRANEWRPTCERCMATATRSRAPPQQRSTEDSRAQRSFFPLQTQSQLFAVAPDSHFSATGIASAGARFKMQLATCADDGHAARAIRICTDMKRANITPDVNTYNWLIHACAKQGLAHECLAFLDDMEALSLKPTIETYNHVIYAQRWTPNFYMDDLLDRMRKAGLRANTHTYHHIILRHAEAQNLEMCLQCFSEMSESNVSPSLRSAQVVIGLASELGHARLALDLAYAFEASSVRKLEAQDWVRVLSVSTGCHFESGVVDGWQKAIVEHNVTPDEGQCIEVLHTAGRLGLTEMALHALEFIRTLEVPLQEYHLVPILGAFCKQGMLEDAFSVINLMRSNGIPLSQDTAGPIFGCICQDLDEIDKAWGILEKMHKEDKPVDVVSLNTIVEASTRLRDLQRAIGTYKAFDDLGVKPSVETFNHLLSGCISLAHKELGDKLLAELREQGLIPNADTFERVILLCLTQTTYEDAFFYLEEMKGQGHPPPLIVYESLVKKCVVSGDARWQLAVDELQQCGYKVSQHLHHFIDTGGKVTDRGRRVVPKAPGGVSDQGAIATDSGHEQT